MPLALTLLLLVGVLLAPQEIEAQDPAMELARKVLTETPLVDGHNDLPWAIRGNDEAPMDVAAYDLRAPTSGHTDLARLDAGMVGAQFWSVYVSCSARNDGAARTQLEELDIAHRMIERYPEALAFAGSASEVEQAFGSGKVASLLGMEGGHVIENSLGALRAFHRAGARYLTLTHGCTLDWADSSTDTVLHGGLTRFGEEVVREMNRLGMLVDLSHVSPGTMSDALNVAEAPVIFSHSSAKALTDHARNVPDSILARLPENGGVVMVTFVPVFVSEELRRWSERRSEVPDEREEAWMEENPRPDATLDDVADHIEHVRAVAGIDHVGIGSDFDGISSTPVGLEDVSTFPALFAELARRGWSEAELKKLAGGNLLRVMREAEATARLLQIRREPSTATIQELDGSGME